MPQGLWLDEEGQTLHDATPVKPALHRGNLLWNRTSSENSQKAAVEERVTVQAIDLTQTYHQREKKQTMQMNRCKVFYIAYMQTEEKKYHARASEYPHEYIPLEPVLFVRGQLVYLSLEVQTLGYQLIESGS